MNIRFTRPARELMRVASLIATSCGRNAADADCIFSALQCLDICVARVVLDRVGLISLALKHEPTPSSVPEDYHELVTQELLSVVSRISQEMGHSYIGTEHFLLAVARSPGRAEALLAKHGITFDALKCAVIETLG